MLRDAYSLAAIIYSSFGVSDIVSFAFDSFQKS